MDFFKYFFIYKSIIIKSYYILLRDHNTIYQKLLYIIEESQYYLSRVIKNYYSL